MDPCPLLVLLRERPGRLRLNHAACISSAVVHLLAEDDRLRDALQGAPIGLHHQEGRPPCAAKANGRANAVPRTQAQRSPLCTKTVFSAGIVPRSTSSGIADSNPSAAAPRPITLLAADELSFLAPFFLSCALACRTHHGCFLCVQRNSSMLLH